MAYNFNNQYNPYTNQNTYAYVNGLEGAKAYQVMPNQSVLLIDSDSPMIYMKTGNAMGQANIQAFEIHQIDLNNQSKVINNPSIEKDEFESLLKRVEALEKKTKKFVEVEEVR